MRLPTKKPSTRSSLTSSKGDKDKRLPQKKKFSTDQFKTSYYKDII